MRLARYQRPDLWTRYGFNRLTSLQDEISRLFESSFTNGEGSDVFNTWAPALDVYEDSDSLIVRAEIPGMKKENIEISFKENVLTISGERHPEKRAEGSQPAREERFFGRFTRSISLKKQVNLTSVKAAYNDGILTVTLPKAEEAKPRQIEVQGN